MHEYIYITDYELENDIGYVIDEKEKIKDLGKERFESISNSN